MKQLEAQKKAGNISYSGSLADHWDPHAHAEAGFGHGNVTQRWGRTWKWHQVALGVSVGVPLEEWDDAIHTPSEEFIAYGHDDHRPRSLSCADSDGSCVAVPENASLAERDAHVRRWDFSKCRALLSCSQAFASSLNINGGWNQAVHAAYKLKTYGSTFYDWAHAHPFSVSIALTTGSTLTGYGLGYSHGGATAADNDELGKCSDDVSQVESFIQIFTDNGAGNLNAAQTDITLSNGHILALSGEVFPRSVEPRKVCDAEGE